jgi:hypothetical protein
MSWKMSEECGRAYRQPASTSCAREASRLRLPVYNVSEKLRVASFTLAPANSRSYDMHTEVDL